MARNPAKLRIQEEIQAMGAADRAAGGVLFKVLDELDAMQEGIDAGGGGGIEAGATLPATPTQGDLFIHEKAETYRILKYYNGTLWVAIEHLQNTSLNLYIDPVNGTDDIEHGFSSGTDALQSLTYLTNTPYHLPTVSNGQPVNIYVYGGATLTGAQAFSNRNANINIEGVPVDIATGLTVTGQVGGSITYAGETWSVDEHAGRWLKSGTNYYYIISNTADTLEVRENLNVAVGAADTIQEFPTLAGTISTYSDQFTLKYMNLVANAFGFLLNIYGSDFVTIKAVNLEQLSVNLGRCLYLGQYGGSAIITDTNLEASVNVSQLAWINNTAGVTVGNSRFINTHPTPLATAQSILLKWSNLNMYQSYLFGAGILAEFGSTISNSNTVADTITIEDAFVGIDADLSSVIDPTDYIFTNCTTDTILRQKAASNVEVDASGFTGNLSGTDADVQTALTTLDALAGGGGIEIGDTLPTSPVENDVFWHVLTGRSILYRYNGTYWFPVIADGGVTVYVDPDLGTDDLNLGFGAGANAFATAAFATQHIPPFTGNSVTIYLSNATHATFGLYYTSFCDATFNIIGTRAVEASPTVTSSGLGFVTCSAESWTTDEHVGRLINVTGGDVFVTSNDATTLFFADNIDPGSPATVDIESLSKITSDAALYGLNVVGGNVSLRDCVIENARNGGTVANLIVSSGISMSGVKLEATLNGKCLIANAARSFSATVFDFEVNNATQIHVWNYASDVLLTRGRFGTNTTTGSHCIVNYKRGAYIELTECYLEKRGIYLLEAGKIYAVSGVEIDGSIAGIVEATRLSGPHDLSGVTFTGVTTKLSLQSFRGALVGKNATNSAGTAAWTAATFQVEEYDEGGWFTAGSPTRLTVPVGVSKVRLTGCLGCAGNASGYRIFSIRRNGSDTYGYGTVRNSTTSADPLKFNIQSAVLEVNEGDYFELALYHTAGVSLDLTADGNIFFSIEQVE